jgi:enoyl-CoA hydratase/carnithine racemase
MGIVTYDQDGAIGMVTLSHPPQNRLNGAMIEELASAVESAEAGHARVLLIRGAGDHFSFGVDLAEWVGLSTSGMRTYLLQLNQVYQRVEGLAIPTVAAVRGGCMGGGLELALHCDFIVAARDAQLRFPEPTIALPPLGGGLQRLAERAGRAQAARMAMLSGLVSGAEAQQLGLIARLADSAEVADVADALARQLADGPTLAYAGAKAILKASSEGGVGAADRLLLDIGHAALASEDFARAVPSAVDALQRNVPRPALNFSGK